MRFLYELFDDKTSNTDLDTDTVIVTGGRFSYVLVSIYNEVGWVRNLKGLNKKRCFHECTSFV